MQGYHLVFHSNLLPKEQVPTATHSRGAYNWLRVLQAFRGLHDSARSGRTLPCRARRYTPCNFSAHSINSKFQSDAQPLLDCMWLYRFQSTETAQYNFDTKIPL
jgi:hypothetical protein